jgi:REP-associated tyrosine transposase
MPRQTRIDAPGALHHVLIRGIERRKIFKDDADRENFLDRLGGILAETSTACYGWALLANRVHLLLRTGTVPLATVMARLLTGYVVSFNRRHRRHGYLFQNRYKSILCQEDPYLLELVRYIHLNPLRARMVRDLQELEGFPYAGHGALLGKRKRPWQDVAYVLGQFGGRVTEARRRYRAYVKEGLGQGKRPELVGGGLIRSPGGWVKAKALRKKELRLKGDERILGDSDFVIKVLEQCEEGLARRYRLQAGGYDFGKLLRRAAELCAVSPEEISTGSKRPRVVEARSLLCFWAVREFGMSATAVAKRLKISQPAVSISVRRGEKISRDRAITLTDT